MLDFEFDCMSGGTPIEDYGGCEDGAGTIENNMKAVNVLSRGGR